MSGLVPERIQVMAGGGGGGGYEWSAWYQNVSRSWAGGYEWSGTRTYTGHGEGGWM